MINYYELLKLDMNAAHDEINDAIKIETERNTIPEDQIRTMKSIFFNTEFKKEYDQRLMQFLLTSTESKKSGDTIISSINAEKISLMPQQGSGGPAKNCQHMCAVFLALCAAHGPFAQRAGRGAAIHAVGRIGQNQIKAASPVARGNGQGRHKCLIRKVCLCKVQPVGKAKVQGIGGGGLHKGGLPFQPKPRNCFAAQGQRQQGRTAAAAKIGRRKLLAPRLVHAFHAACGKGRQQQGVCAKAQAAVRLLQPTREKLPGAVKGFLRMH